MLREVKSSILGLRITPFSMQYSGGTPVIGLGYNNFSTITDTGVGRLTLKHDFAYQAGTVAVLSRNQSGVGGAQGFAEVVSSSIAATGIELDARSNDGGGLEDCGFDGFLCGWDSVTTQTSAALPYPKFPVKCSLEGPRIIGCQISSAGSVTIGVGEVSCVKNGTGDYTVTFKRAFGRPPAVKVSTIGATYLCEMLGTKTAQSVQVLLKNAATGVAADAAFNLIALGTTSQLLENGSFQVLQGYQRRPRVLVCGAKPSAGTSSLIFGSGRGISSITDIGVGDTRFNYQQPFAREPIVVVTGCNNGTVCQAKLVTSNSSQCRVQCLNGAEVATDDTVQCHVFILGSDDTTDI